MTLQKKPVILIVDDEYTIRKICAVYLEKEYQLQLEENGKDAIESMRRNSFINLAVIDLNLPDMDGLKVMEEWKRLNPSLPVVIMSAYLSDEYVNRQKSFISKADAILKKPFYIEELKRIIDNLLGRAPP